MKNKALNLVMACTLLASVGAQAATFERDVKVEDQTQKSTDVDANLGTAEKKSTDVDAASIRNGVKKTVENATRTTKAAGDTIKSGSETLKALTTHATEKGLEKTVQVVETVMKSASVNKVVVGSAAKFEKIKSSLMDIFKDNSFNAAQAEEVLSGRKIQISNDPTVAASERKAILDYIDLIHTEHFSNVKLSAVEFEAKLKEYDGSRALDVYGEILERAARKLAAGETDALQAIFNSEVDIFMERKGLTKEEATNEALKLKRNKCA